jgi:UDP-N-acetylglucosamine 3-dehydrogenase
VLDFAHLIVQDSWSSETICSKEVVVVKIWRAGVIGCGAIAQALHLPGYLRTPGVELSAACDPSPQRRREAARMGGADFRAYADHREMLASEQLDVVSVATPNRFHAEHAVAALEAGAHVLLEKPAALSMQEIRRIGQAVKRSGRLLVMGFSQRFYRGNQRMRKLIAEGAIGEPYMFRARLAHRGPLAGWAKSDWFHDPVLAGGGALLDLGIHVIDQCLWLMGPVRSVQAKAATLRKEILVDDNAVLLLEFERPRALGYIEAGWTSPAGFQGIEIMGDKGVLRQDYAGQTTLTTGRISANVRIKPKLRTRIIDRDPRKGGWDTEVTEVVRALRAGSDLGCGIEAGGAALAVALAAYESSRTGKRVLVK